MHLYTVLQPHGRGVSRMLSVVFPHLPSSTHLAWSPSPISSPTSPPTSPPPTRSLVHNSQGAKGQEVPRGLS